ncbi:hypothetical protein ACFX2A_004448 [Malus domestica]
MNEMEHWRLQSDMIVVEDVEFQDQSESARSQMLELVVHEVVVVVVVEQCLVGIAHVSTLMKICWPSKSDAKETRMPWRNCFHPNLIAFAQLFELGN